MKQFKSLIAYTHNVPMLTTGALQGDRTKLKDLQALFEKNAISDPVGSQWSRMGMLGNADGAMYYQNEVATLVYVSIRERVLPGPVIKAEVAKRAAKIAEQQGRRCNRKELAELRDEAELKLLPKSHIKETFVPIILRKDWMFVCTSSAKRAEQVAFFMQTLFADQSIMLVQTKDSVAGWMTALAVDGMSADDTYWPGDAITVAGSGTKGVIAFRNEDAHGERITSLISTAGYGATKMRVDSEHVAFTLNSGLILSSIKFHDIISDQFKDIGQPDSEDDRARMEFDSTLAIVAKEFERIMTDLVDMMGGQQIEEQDDDLDRAVEKVVTRAKAVRAQIDQDAPQNGPTRSLTFWKDENSGEVFYLRSTDDEPDDAETIQINQDEFSQHGGTIADDDVTWMLFEDEPDDSTPEETQPQFQYAEDDNEL